MSTTIVNLHLKLKFNKNKRVAFERFKRMTPFLMIPVLLLIKPTQILRSVLGRNSKHKLVTKLSKSQKK